MNVHRTSWALLVSSDTRNANEFKKRKKEKKQDEKLKYLKNNKVKTKKKTQGNYTLHLPPFPSSSIKVDDDIFFVFLLFFALNLFHHPLYFPYPNSCLLFVSPFYFQRILETEKISWKFVNDGYRSSGLFKGVWWIFFSLPHTVDILAVTLRFNS